jgi:hypothetical protein
MKTALSFFLVLIQISVLAQNGIITGRVSDAKNNEPVPFANIIIQGTTIGGASDIEGKYKLTGLTAGLYNLEVSFIGYKNKMVFEIQVSNNKPAVVDFALEEDSKTLETVEIKAKAFVRKEESPVSLRTIGVNEIERTPGGNRDISRTIQSLPGVASSTAFRNDIIIRGGAPNENRFYLDGIEVPNINHFATQGSSGGPTGMINVDFIREVDFYSGAFPSNRGNALSSVLDFKMKDPRQDRIGGKFTLGSSDAGITIEGPIAKGHSFMFSYRRSYLQFLFKALKLPFLPTYDDFQLKYKAKLSNKDQLTVIGLGAIDQFSLNLDANETEDQRYLLNILPVNEQWNYTIGANWKHFNSNGYSELVASRNMLNNTAVKYRSNVEDPDSLTLDYDSREMENKLRFENNFRKNGWKLNYGVGYEYARYTNSTSALGTAPDGTNFSTNFSSAIDMHKWSLFGQLSKAVFEGRLQTSFGIRFDGNSYSDQMAKTYETASPRLSLSYAFAPRWSVNFNVGRYFQLPAYTVMGFRDNADNLVNKQNGLKYIGINHIVGGVEWLSKFNMKVSVEGFYKLWENYPFLVRDSITLANLGGDFGVIGNDEVESISAGRSYGAELLIQQKLFKGFFGILAYTFVRSEFQDRKNDYVPSSWDSQHLLTLTFGKKFKYNYELGIRWRFLGGTPYTPYDVGLSAQTRVWDINQRALVDYTRLNEERLGSSHILDLRIDKKWYFKKWALNLYLDIQNAYNFQSGTAGYYDTEKDDSGNPIIDPDSDPNNPSYLLKFIDNPSGTVIPSFGIVIEI